MTSKQQKAPTKKPSGGRPIAQRLFSKDSSTSSSGEQAQDAAVTTRLPLTALKETTGVGRVTPWASDEIVSSPASSMGEAAEPYFVDPSSSTSSARSSSSSVPLHAPVPRQSRHTKLSFDFAGPASPPPQSPSKLRWEHLRQHVMPSVTSISSKISSSSNAAVASALPTVTSPTPSFSSFSQINVPIGAPTPKPSRFPRFGFRQVVTEARVVADDLTRRFSEEIHRACWSVRFDEIVKSKSMLKFEREGSQGSALGSALSLPMKSSASLPLSNASTSNLLGSGALKRPPSMATLSLTNSARSTALANLQGVIIRYASVAKQRETTYLYLPHEREVLSAILIVFLSQSTGRIADDDRRLSMEIFETIVRTWRTPLPDGEIDRCLWCCKAATMPASPLRSRVLLNLTFILSREPLLTTPVSFRTIVPSIALLIPSFTQSSDSEADLQAVKHVLSDIVAGNCGRLDLADLEQKYNAIALNTDSEEDLRRGICLDALLRSLEVGSPTQQHLLHRSIEVYWPEPDISIPYTPLRTKIHVGKINTFLRAAARLLHQLSDLDSPSEFSAASASILRMLSLRVLPELDSMGNEVRESRRLAVKVAMALACVDSVERFQAAEFIIGWLENSFWKQCVEDEMRELATAAEWLTTISIAEAILDVLPTDIKKTLSALMIPQFHERLVSEPPPYPCDALSQLFRIFAHVNPQMFYKPLFTCAASSKELIIAHHLTILIAVGRYLPDLWTTDAEMIAVATMSDVSVARKGKQKEVELMNWGQARPGQCIVLLEVIGALRSARMAQKEMNTVLNESHMKVVKFATSLEARLNVWLGAREQTSLLPLSHRCLIATLLLEIRLITRSLKTAQWLRNIVIWTIQFHGSHQVQSVGPETEAEVLETRDVIHNIWASAKEGLRPHKHRRSTVILSPKLDTVHSTGTPEPYDASFDGRFLLFSALEGPPIRPMLELLVAMSGALSKENYVELSPGLWGGCLESEDSKTAIYASFLNMQCAEKASFEYLQMVTRDLKSNDSTTRKRAVTRLGALSSWRFQLLSLTYITDKTHRRPFKLARPPIAFVPTDVGSANYVHVHGDEDGPQQKIPPDLRRRLSEIGWSNDDEPMDQLLEWLRTPMSLLATPQLDFISKHTDADTATPEIGRSGSPSPASSPLKSPRGGGNLLRRNSSSGGHQNVKRRPVFVQPLLSVFVQLTALSLEMDFAAASLARDLLLDFMRDDPTVLCRSIMEAVSEGNDGLDTAVFALRSFLHVGKLLPPRLSHHVFGHLAGFLKYLARETDAPDSFRQLAHVIPSLAKYAPQVSDLSVQAVRRAKIEVFLFPSGQLWFPESAPQTSMFPKGPGQNTNPFEEFSSSLMHMLMIRTSQNMLFVDLLKRNPHDVHFLRKSWVRLVLPSVEGYSENDSPVSMDISREHHKTSISRRGGDFVAISISFARSHLSLVAQTLRCLTRHLNDRFELEMILDGVNRILLRHADDIGIVGQALIVYMIASTRFRRLMAANGGFSLFIPVLIKVYCESEGNVGIKEAIEYSVHKFFAVHEEAFVYQTLDAVSTLVYRTAGDNEWLAGCVYGLLSTLKSGPSSAADSAGIRDVNKPQEEETALAITADERPQFFLAALKAEGKMNLETVDASLSAGIFDNKKFQPDNIVRLLLTVIGHDPSTQRAERFLRLFRYMAPHFYNASSSARTVLRDGMAAVGSMLYTKLSGKTKAPDPSNVKLEGGDQREDAAATHERIKNQLNSQTVVGDPQAMRADYISALAAYVKTGGQVRTEAFRVAVGLAIILLKDSVSSKAVSDCVSTFMSMIGQGLCSREDLKLATSFLKELVPIINLHGSSLDFTGFLKALTSMSFNPIFANDELFSKVVVHQICSTILDMCEAVAEYNLVETLPYHSAFISLLSNAVGLLGSDIMGEIEKHEPTIGMLTGIVLPLALTLRTTSDLTVETQWTDSRRQDAHARAWIRLASMATKAFHPLAYSGNTKVRSTSVSDASSPQSLGEKSGGKKSKSSAEDGQRSSTRCIVSLAILKLIIVRGEDDMTAVMPGVWIRISAMLRSLLDEGSTMFAFRQLPVSPNASPLPSPMVDRFPDKFVADKPAHRRTSSSEDKHNSHFLLRPNRSSPSVPPSPTSPSIARHSSGRLGVSDQRVVDYLLWSFLEFACRRRSPLTLQLRTFMHEKLVPLHESLLSLNAGTEPTHSSSRQRRSLRPVSTIFSKPRMSMAMGFRSTGPSPEASPRLGPSESLALKASNPPHLSLDVSALSEMPLSLSPGHTPSNSLKKRIVHLGPQFRSNSPTFISPSSTSESISAVKKGSDGDKDSSDIRKIISLARVRSRALQQRTYERVRIVQACSGYRTLLALPTQTISSRSNSLDAPGSVDHGFERYSRLGGMPSVASPRASAEFGVDSEPDVASWTKGQAVDVLLNEVREIVEAWENGFIFVPASNAELVQGDEVAQTGSVESGPTSYGSVSGSGMIGLGL